MVLPVLGRGSRYVCRQLGFSRLFRFTSNTVSAAGISARGGFRCDCEETGSGSLCGGFVLIRRTRSILNRPFASHPGFRRRWGNPHGRIHVTAPAGTLYPPRPAFTLPLTVTDRSQSILDRTVEADKRVQVHTLDAAAANLNVRNEPRRARHNDIPTRPNPGVTRRNEDAGEDGEDDDVQSMSGESSSPTALETAPYAGNAGRILELNDALRECRLEQFFSLPKAAVIGNKSSGKGSLLEAISQIKVPRDDKGCTKCPIELTSPLSEGAMKVRSGQIATSQTISGNRISFRDHSLPILRVKHIEICPAERTQHRR